MQGVLSVIRNITRSKQKPHLYNQIAFPVKILCLPVGYNLSNLDALTLFIVLYA